MHHESEVDVSILSPSELLKKIMVDLYFGNGKPALTLRVAGIEDQQEMFKEALEAQTKWQSRMTTLLIGTLVSSVGGLFVIVIELLKH